MNEHMLITAQAVAEAITIEREACAKLADEWLALWGDRKPEHISAQTWACDAIRDLADAIRARSMPSPNGIKP